MSQKIYTTALAKGQGAIPETLALLQVWKPGMTAAELAGQALATGTLARATAHRVNDIVARVFRPRYLADGGHTASGLRYLVSQGFPPRRMVQLLFIHSARANVMLHDFVRQVYWPHYAAGMRHLRKQDSSQFIESAHNNGLIPKPWSASMRDRVARYLLGVLQDFELLGPLHDGVREFLPFSIYPLTTLYLAHELRFSGLSDTTLLHHRDWGLFGLEPRDVVQELGRASSGGHFIVQYSGEILRIAWKYKTMEECLDGIAAGEL
jgi:hypothetical protein